MVIILTEKPSAARNFAKALGGMGGNFNGESYEIVHALGHVYKFPDRAADIAGEKYKNWSFNVLPWNKDDFKWKKVKGSGVSDVIKTIQAALKKADEVVVSTDLDPSGEGGLLAFEILDALKWKGRTTRAVFMDESEKEIVKALKNRKEIDLKKWDEQIKADTRSKFDYLSMQFTVAASLAAQSAGRRMTIRQGRLKSVMVYLVGQQLEEVNGYVKKPFYTARYQDENGHVYKRKDADEDRYTEITEVSLEMYGPSDVIVDKEETKTSAPPSLLDLAALSSVLASQGYKAKTVLSVYQKLYEAQIVSYPRTEDKFISEEQFNELLPLANKIAEVVGVDGSFLTHTISRPTHVKNGGAHGANRPGPKVPSSLSEIEEKYGKLGVRIYEILAKSFLALLAEDYVYSHQAGYLKDYPEFRGSANIPISMGYKAVFDSDALNGEEEENVLPLGKRAESFVYEGANPKPQNPTQNWLIGKNGKLTKYNVGTGATRTSTLAEITSASKTQLMTEDKGVLGLTEIGWTSYKLLNGCYIASPEVTEQLFNDMEKVGRFEMNPDDVLAKVEEITAHDMKVMKENARTLAEKIPQEASQEDGREKVMGEYKGKEISFNRVWGGHRFSDEEVEKLLNGEEISFEAVSKKGKEYTATGRLEQQTYKGHKFWGFKAVF